MDSTSPEPPGPSILVIEDDADLREAIFNLLWPTQPVVYASGGQGAPPSSLWNGIFLRKPFAMDRLVRAFEAGAIASRARWQLT